MPFSSDEELGRPAEKQQDNSVQNTCQGAVAKTGRAEERGDVQWSLPPPLPSRGDSKNKQSHAGSDRLGNVGQTLHQWAQGIPGSCIPEQMDGRPRKQNRGSEPIFNSRKGYSLEKQNMEAMAAPKHLDKAIQEIVELPDNRLEVLSNLEKIVYGVKRSLSLREESERTYTSRQSRHGRDGARYSSAKGTNYEHEGKEQRKTMTKSREKRRTSTPALASRPERLETPVRGLTPIHLPHPETSSDESYRGNYRDHRRRSTSGSSSQEERPSRSHLRIRRHRRRTRSGSSGSRGSGEQDQVFIRRMVAILKGAGVGSGCGVPEPEIFAVSKGTSFSQFLDHFEKYCEHRYAKHKDYWVKELEKFLDGDIKEVYLSIKKPRTKYREMKEMLTEWYVDTRRHRISTKRIQFEQATRKHGEDLSVFAVRLESLAKEAYPRHNMSISRELREKFLSAIPSKANKFIVAHNWQTKQITGHKLTWRQIKELVAMEYSTSSKRQDSEEGSDSDRYTTHRNYRNVYFGESKVKESKLKEPIQVAPPRCEKKEEPAEKCKFCDKDGHKSEECKRKPGVCWECGGENHLARHCLQRLKRNTGNKQGNNKVIEKNRRYYGNQQTPPQWNTQMGNNQQGRPQRWNNRHQQHYYPHRNQEQNNRRMEQQYWTQGQDQAYWQQQNAPNWSQNENQQEN